MKSISTQTEYVPLAEPILINVIDNEEQINNDDEEDCWGCCFLILWYTFLCFISIFFFTNIFT